MKHGMPLLAWGESPPQEHIGRETQSWKRDFTAILPLFLLEPQQDNFRRNADADRKTVPDARPIGNI